MLETVCYGFIYLFEVLACYLFFENYYDRKVKGIYCLVANILSFAFQFGMNFVSVRSINLITFVISVFLIAFLCYEAKLRSVVFSTAMLTVIMFVTELIVIYFSTYLFKINLAEYENNLLVLVVQSSLSKLLFFVVIFFVSKCSKNKIYKDKTDKFTFWLALLPLTSLAIFYTMHYWGVQTADVSSFNVALAICTILLLFANIFVFYIYETVQKTNYENLQLQLEQQKTKISAEYYSLLADEYEKSRVLIHDIKNHLRYIETKTADGSPQEVFDYIDSIREDFGLNERIRYSGSSIIDVIINRYHNQCKKAGVDFEVEAFCSNLDFMADNDIIAMLDNMFDNGFEAAIKSEGKRMMLSAYIRNDDYISIEMKNSSDKAPLSIAGKLVTTKGNPWKHGYGTKSIRRVIRKYEGTFKWSYDEKERFFTATAVVKMKKPKK